MLRRPQGFKSAALTLLGAATLACSTSQPQATGSVEAQLEQKQQQVSELERALRDKESTVSTQQDRIDRLSRELERARGDVAAAPPSVGSDLLPKAAPGQCYARVVVPAKYKTDTVRVLKKEADSKIEIIPARYEWVTEKVLVKEASEKIVKVAPVFETVSERVLVKPAHTAWKKGRGPIERVDNSTGEIMCLVEVPAEYKTVKKRVLRTPATTRRVKIPAEYKNVRVRKLVQPPKEKRITIPAQYSEVSKRMKISEERMEWRSVLCETNASRELISSVQRALKEAGHDPGPIDGVLGRQTLTAVREYQQRKSLPTGGLTITTLDALGVKVGR